MHRRSDRMDSCSIFESNGTSYPLPLSLSTQTCRTDRCGGRGANAVRSSHLFLVSTIPARLSIKSNSGSP